MIRKRNKQRQTREWITANQHIKFPEVRVLSEYGEQLGVMDTRDALARARQEEKDLVLITEQARPPVVKIIDMAKHRYQLQQKKAEGRKKSRVQDIKEIRFTPFMGEADFESRLAKVIGFLKKGDKVRLTLQFKGRAITKKEFGFNQFARVIEATNEIATVEVEPKLMGKNLMAQLSPSGKAK